MTTWEEFQIVWCETNLRWLAGEPVSDERTRKERYMVSEIERLQAILSTYCRPQEG